MGGCHWKVTLTAMGDSLEGRKERILSPLAQDTPFLLWKSWPQVAGQDGLGWDALGQALTAMNVG